MESLLNNLQNVLDTKRESPIDLDKLKEILIGSDLPKETKEDINEVFSSQDEHAIMQILNLFSYKFNIQQMIEQ